MPEDTKPTTPPEEPRGLGEHARGLAAEYAHEQGWGLEEEQRTQLPEGKQDTDGGSDYEYGARDFGDEPTNTDRFKTNPLEPGQK
jgi:hypothetical protein